MKIKCLIFDLSEVLIRGLAGIETMLAPMLGKPESAILTALGKSELTDLCRGKISEDDYWDAIISRENWVIEPDRLKTIVRDNFREIIPAMPDMVIEFREKYDYALILMSDHAREWIDYIESRHDFLQAFQRRIYSFQAGYLKNQQESWHFLIRHTGFKPQQCIFIDDNISNIRTSWQLGYHSIHFRDYPSCRKKVFEVIENSQQNS